MRTLFSIVADPVLWVAMFFFLLGMAVKGSGIAKKDANWWHRPAVLGWASIGLAAVTLAALVAQRLHWIE